MHEPLLGSEVKSQRCCGVIDCNYLISWRGTGSNRRLWKMFCSLCLIALFAIYIMIVLQFPLLILFGSLTILKMLIETWGQDTPNWVCPGGVFMFLVIYVLILPFIIYADGVCTSNQDIPPDLFTTVPWMKDALGTVLFFFGYTYSLSYEVGRFKWKAKEENKGKLHTIGLARFCIHPNYFGDLFTYTGWGLCAGTSCALSGPVYMVWSFIVLVNPNSDAYLAERYGREFPDYARRTATLIPGLHGYYSNQLLAWICFFVGGWLGNRCTGHCDNWPTGL
jgi:protein-S-isoprenylcysteine O-methyltransferase Ste14